MNARASAGILSTVLLSLGICVSAGAEQSEDRLNYFDDPFLQATSGIPDCPVPEGPSITKSQMLAESHYRADRGINCYEAGRCRLPNSHLYDKEIIPRTKKTIEATGRFVVTSVWVEGQRRWVWLKGCVRRQSESEDLKRLVRELGDVESVINQLSVRPK